MIVIEEYYGVTSSIATKSRKAFLTKETLKDKLAVIYGAVGSTAAHAFVREGASVFLAGRSTSKLNKVAEDIFFCWFECRGSRSRRAG